MIKTDQVITASLVLFHNSELYITTVINSIINSSSNIKLYVIDNSTTDSLRFFLSDYDLIYIKNESNIGFGKAHNIGIKKAIELKSDYHIIINPDISFDTDVIESLAERTEKDKEIGLIMPKIVYPNNSMQYLCKLLPTPVNLIFRRFLPFKKIVKKLNDSYELRNMDFTKEFEVPSLSGCFMFVRTSVLEKVGGFDERYFMYLEDVDLCRKIGEISKLIYYPDVSVVHNYEKGSYKNKKLLIYHIKSSIKYFNKWGWFFDSKRNEINNKAIKRIH
jgi:GT2 family glycosyltransferase